VIELLNITGSLALISEDVVVSELSVIDINFLVCILPEFYRDFRDPKFKYSVLMKSDLMEN
jgi:hypothetical protein